MATNPYNLINPMAFPLRKLTESENTEVFLFRPDSQSALDVCIFRDHLSRFLLDELHEAKMQSGSTGIMIEVRKGLDAQRLRLEFNAR